jgi:hypothetical protein
VGLRRRSERRRGYTSVFSAATSQTSVLTVLPSTSHPPLFFCKATSTCERGEGHRRITTGVAPYPPQSQSEIREGFDSFRTSMEKGAVPVFRSRAPLCGKLHKYTKSNRTNTPIAFVDLVHPVHSGHDRRFFGVKEGPCAE